MKKRLLFFSLIVLLAAGSTFGQGVQTSTLTGTVVDPDGTPLPGVTVTVTSRALMGERQAVTSATGDYVLRGLPPGEYTIRFVLQGMQTVQQKMTLALGLDSRADAKMKVAAVSEAITVTASAPTVLENTTVGANIKSETVQQLPVLRNPIAIAQLSAGVTGDRGGRDGTPVAGQLSINGGMAYDNSLLINGVNFQDNIFGTANNLFVEEAIQETQVLTSGISAEYGHFTGGVINVITKSGGNDFSGSIRDNITKPSWLALSPYEEGYRGEGVTPAAPIKRTGDLSNVYELTLGGPVVRDRLWFFVAARDEKSTTPQTLAVTGVQFNLQTKNRRPEFKVTAALTSNHTIQGSYIDNPVDRNYEVQVTPLEMAAVGVNSQRVNHGWTGYYNGVLSTSLFGEARYSEKLFGFRGLGGTSTDIHDSPMLAADRWPGNSFGTYNAPYFDATDPEDRSNKQYFASLSYFLSKPNYGSHDLKAGFERFVDTRTGGNSQSATSYVFDAGFKTKGGLPVYDSSGRLIPMFIPMSVDPEQVNLIEWWVATRGAKLDTTTDSLFINDKWTLNSHFGFNIGARYEKVKTESTGGIVGVDTSNIVPRLAVSYDPMANGKYKFDVTYASYVGRYNPAIVGANSPVGNPASIYGYYVGPAGEGRNFEPGFDPNNYVFYSASVPTANVFMRDNLHAAVNNEWTASAGMQLGQGGWLKGTYTWRKLKDMIDDFILIDQGCTNISYAGVDVGCVDNIYNGNSNLPKRQYQAIELQAHYNLTRVWGLEGNWTHQLKNDGNYEGEGGQSFALSPLNNRPEMQSPREVVSGRLSQFQADRIRLWTTYSLDLKKAGNLTAGLIWRYDSPRTFSYTASVPRSSISTARNPGYKSAAPSVTLFFGDRGAGEFASSSLFDVSLQYSIPILSKVTPWVKFDVRNALNADTLIAWNTAISAVTNGPTDDMGYPTEYIKRSSFGRPTAATSYVRPREYLLYLGVRF